MFLSMRRAGGTAALWWREKKAVGWQEDTQQTCQQNNNAFLVNFQPLKKRQKFLSRQLRPGIGRQRT